MRAKNLDQVIVRDLVFTGKSAYRLLMLASIGALVVDGMMLFGSYEIGKYVIDKVVEWKIKTLNTINDGNIQD